MEKMLAVDTSSGLDDIRIVEIPKPVPTNGEVLIKTECSAVEDGEAQVLNKTLVGMFLHRKTSPLILGWNVVV